MRSILTGLVIAASLTACVTPLTGDDPGEWRAGAARLDGRPLSTEWLESLVFSHDPVTDHLTIRLKACNTVSFTYAVVDRRQDRAGLRSLQAVATSRECAQPQLEASEDSWIALLRSLKYWDSDMSGARLVADSDSDVALIPVE